MALVLPVQLQNKATGNFIIIERFLPVNIFFGHLIESVNIYKKDDLTRIAPPLSYKKNGLTRIVLPLPSGSVGQYMSKILQYITE